MAKEVKDTQAAQAVKIQLSLKVPVASAQKSQKDIDAVEAYLATPNIADVVNRWPTLPADVREKIMAAAPMFARIVAIARRFA